MKTLLFSVLICLTSIAASGQYYYNDLVMAREIMKKRDLYQQQQVKSVTYNGFDNNNQPIDGFKCSQTIKDNFTVIITHTSSPVTGTTENTAYFNAKGQLIKSVDTSDGNKTTVNYDYDENNRITGINNESVSAGQYFTGEQHRWFYNEKGQPVKMWKIKNGSDTTYVSFVSDEQGNTIEEKSVHKGQEQPAVYYYYNADNNLTDIVRWNRKARKLLPDYIFEYNNNQQLSTMIVVPEGSNDYQKWYYTYNEKGLKIKDECYSRTKNLIGRIEYQYRF